MFGLLVLRVLWTSTVTQVPSPLRFSAIKQGPQQELSFSRRMGFSWYSYMSHRIVGSIHGTDAELYEPQLSRLKAGPNRYD